MGKNGHNHGPAESKTSERLLKAYDKGLQALELRKKGHTFVEIAAQVGYRGPGGAYEAVMSAIRRTFQEPADEVRKLELERLDKLLLKYSPKVEAGDVRAGELYLKAMERRAAYLGLDAPKRTDNTMTGVVLVVTADELAKIYRRARQGFLSEGGQPLGLADGGGEGERPATGDGDDPLPALAPPAAGAPGDSGIR